MVVVVVLAPNAISIAIRARICYIAGVDPTRPISEGTSTSQLPQGCARLFVLPFLVAGLFMAYKIALQPMYQIVQAKRWPTVPCQIIASAAKQERDSDGDITHKFHVAYTYEFEGRKYTSQRQRFIAISSPGSRGRTIRSMERYPFGSTQQCYVDPAHPSEAVLERHFTAELWWGLFAVPFIGVGLTAFAPTRRRKSGHVLRPQPFGGSLAGAESVVPSAEAGFEAQGSQTLQPRENPWARFLGLLIFALFWNGIVFSVVLVDIGRKKSGPPILMLAIFGLVGVAVLAGAIYQGLRFFTPRLQLVLRPVPVALGHTLEIEWSFPHGARGLRDLQLYLEGTEVATYRRGTDTVTDRKKFFELPLVATHDPTQISSGHTSATLPAGLIHSFKSKNNQIEWSIRASGVVQLRPDLSESFLFTVLPLRSRS